MTPVFRDKVFSVIRSGMEAEDKTVPISAEECKELLFFGEKQSLLAVIYNGLKRMNAPGEVLQCFDKRRLQDFYNTVQRDEALRTVSEALDKAGIPYIPLKGAVLRKYYPRSDMRTSSDIDILVREEALNKAVESIETQTLFRKQDRAYHDVSMLSPWFHLELHFSIKENAENIDRLLSRAWEFAAPSGAGSMYSFTPEYQIFHVAAHMCYHFLHGGLGIRSFLDLWLLRNRTAFCEETVRSMCSDCGILKFYDASCLLSEVWMGDAEHTETTALLENFCLTGGVFGSAEFKNAARQREHRGIRYILSRVFPPPYQVKEFYRDKTGKEHMLPYYYMMRLISWGTKDRRKQLRGQMKAILSSDQRYLNSTDELLKRLEL